ncbi:MAG: cation:proton antiporter [TACK group archaeon]|nr:cation:proton antiporter [TACK group archaeon]
MAYGASVVALLVLSVLLIVGKLSEELFSKFRLIPFVGAIVAGIVLGPGLTGIVSASPYVEEFINLGIIFILFMAGVEEELAGILSEKRAMLTGSMIFGLSFAALMLLLNLLLHLPLLESAVLAVVLGMVSAGPFARTLQETGGIRDQKTLRAFAEVMSLEITAILVFAFLATPGSTSNWSLFFATALKVAAVVGLILAFGRFAAERLIGLLESYLRSREASFSMVMGIVLGFGFLAQYVGFNSAIAAFCLAPSCPEG